MSTLRSFQLASLQELRSFSAAWDDLWCRTATASPLVHSRTLLHWVEHFQPAAKFQAFVVRDDQRLLAALPIVPTRLAKVISVGNLPSNDWASCGDLLCDANGDIEPVMDCLVRAFSRLPVQLLWLNEAPLESCRWHALRSACDRAGIPHNVHERYRVGRLTIRETWNAYIKSLSKSHRQTICRAARRLADQGDVQFEMISPINRHMIQPWLHEAFEVEDRSWKGKAGSSVLRTPGMSQFFICQAHLLASTGELRLASLRLNGRMLAFLYGCAAKRTLFAHKIGYDPDFACFSPGQLLFAHLLEGLHSQSQVQSVDLMGPLSAGFVRWHPETYPVGRIVIAPRLLGRATLFAYRNLWRRFRDEPAVIDHEPPPHQETEINHEPPIREDPPTRQQPRGSKQKNPVQRARKDHVARV